jgi:hypothetical protein
VLIYGEKRIWFQIRKGKGKKRENKCPHEMIGPHSSRFEMNYTNYLAEVF